MKGSHKFWCIIAIVIIIFINYVSFFSGIKYPTDNGFNATLAAITIAIDISLIIAVLIYFIHKFNNWLDEKF